MHVAILTASMQIQNLDPFNRIEANVAISPSNKFEMMLFRFVGVCDEGRACEYRQCQAHIVKENLHRNRSRRLLCNWANERKKNKRISFTWILILAEIYGFLIIIPPNATLYRSFFFVAEIQNANHFGETLRYLWCAITIIMDKTSRCIIYVHWTHTTHIKPAVTSIQTMGGNFWMDIALALDISQPSTDSCWDFFESVFLQFAKWFVSSVEFFSQFSRVVKASEQCSTSIAKCFLILPILFIYKIQQLLHTPYRILSPYIDRIHV